MDCAITKVYHKSTTKCASNKESTKDCTMIKRAKRTKIKKNTMNSGIREIKSTKDLLNQ